MPRVRGGGKRGGRGQRNGRRGNNSGQISNTGDEMVINDQSTTVPLQHSTEPQPSTSSTENLSSQLKLVRKNRAVEKKRISALKPDDKKLLYEMKRRKEVNFMLMPDAPVPAKKTRRSSPVRVPCILVAGTPTEPPPRVPQPWELAPKLNIPQVRTASLITSDSTPPVSTPCIFTVPVHNDVSMTGTTIHDNTLTCVASETSNNSALLERQEETNMDGIVVNYVNMPEVIEEVELEYVNICQDNELPICNYNEEIVVSSATDQTESANTPCEVTAESWNARDPNPTIHDYNEDIIGYNVTDDEAVTFLHTDSAECDKEDWLGNIIENTGSDVEIDNVDIDTSIGVAINSCEDTIFPAEFPENVDPEHINQLLRIDAQNDAMLRQMLPPDALEFNWQKDHSIFTGTQEIFTGQSGPTFPLSQLTNPLQALQKIWDENIINLIVEETNQYAKSFPNSSKFWKDVTPSEIWTFLAIIILQGLDPKPVEKEYWYSSLPYTEMPHFREIMPYKRFIMIKRFLHFTKKQIGHQAASTNDTKLSKILPIINHLREKFSSLYYPSQQISLDESLLLWKGRLNFAQKIANKAAQVGIKSYELCESKSGYLWNFIIYSGKSMNNASETEHTYPERTCNDDPDGATARIVYDLARPLFNKGHTIVMDNFYNSPLLSRSLKLHKTDTMGTLRLNREFVPESLKKIVKTEMRIGEIAFSQTYDLSILVWRDANLVSMISTYHHAEIGGKEKYGQYKYRPKVVLDYNLAMGGVDKKDQLLSAFPMERSRNAVWYKKLFRRLINVSIMNANILFNFEAPKLAPRKFRQVLVQNIISQYRGLMPHQIPRVIEVVPQNNDENASACRPQLIGGHYLERNSSSRSRCKWCARKKIITRTAWRCDVCKIALCIEFCFKQYHTSS